MASLPGKNDDGLTCEDIVNVKDAVAKAIDDAITCAEKNHGEIVTVFVTDLVLKYKLTYILTPDVLGQLMTMCFAQEPFRSAIEEMSARFYLNLPSADILWEKLVRTFAVGCSFHSGEKPGSILPDDITKNTVTYEQAEGVLSSNNWLVFICTLVAYHDVTPVKTLKAIG